MAHGTLLLIHPPQQGLMEGFASGLISLANYITQHDADIDVRLLDLGLTESHQLAIEVNRALQGAREPILAGITTTTASYQAALRVAEVIKDTCGSAKVVMGGHHASPEAEVILENHGENRGRSTVDWIIVGEGEAALLTLLRNQHRPSDVPNLVYTDHLDAIRRNQRAPTLRQRDLDAIPPTFRGNGLRSAPGQFHHVTYVSARGCPLKCAFCAVADEAIRTKSVAAVIQDLHHLIAEQGYRRIALEDNFFAHSATRTVDLCHALECLRATLDFTWDCQTRVESMSRPGILETMERAGCEAVYLGVEALQPHLLSYLHKTPSPERYLDTLEVVVGKMLRSSIACYMNLQFGIPVETRGHRNTSLIRLRRLGEAASQAGRTITIFPQLAVLYPGTAHFAAALREQRFGRRTREIFEDFTRWESERTPVLEWMGETFAHGTGGIPEGILDEAELRGGRFRVDGEAVIKIQRYLQAIANLPGIVLFRYGPFLATSHPGSRSADDEVKK